MVNSGEKKSVIPEIPMIICGTSMMTSTSLINPNAFPQHIKKEVTAAANKFALFLNARTELIRSIELARGDMFEHLNRNWILYKQASSKREDIAMVAYSDGLTYMSAFNLFLYELKAFLDIFSQIICLLIDKDSSPVKGFNKAKIDGEKISGGKLINWIRNIGNEAISFKLELLALITKNCTEWINDTVKYRDDLAHEKGIVGFRHMNIPVSHGPNRLTRESIQEPVMPNGINILDYSNNVCENLSKLIEEVLSIIPEMKNDLNTTWDQAKKNCNYV